MKEDIRRRLKAERENFQGADREAADKKILNSFLAAYGNLKNFFIYNSFGSEATTSLITGALLKAGKKVFLPRVEGGNILPVPYGRTVKGAFGIEEPVGQAYYGNIDLTVIPLLAVSRTGYRIGYGKGFYDRFLKGNATRKVGLGYSFQLEDFDGDVWDEPLDEFICENGIVKFRES